MDFDSAATGVGLQGNFLVQLGPANLFGSPDWEPCFVQIDPDLTLRVWASQEEAQEVSPEMRLDDKKTSKRARASAGEPAARHRVLMVTLCHGIAVDCLLCAGRSQARR